MHYRSETLHNFEYTLKTMEGKAIINDSHKDKVIGEGKNY